MLPRHRLVSRPILVCFILMCVAAVDPTVAQWRPRGEKITTRWSADVSPDAPALDYPRPTLVRPRWQSLDGLWQFAVRPRAAGPPAQWDGEILVPYPIESALSGVGRAVSPEERLWYRTTFAIPREWSRDTMLLHFGAVDWDAVVWLNGIEVGRHRGGYDSFSIDLGNALDSTVARQELIVAVTDPTDSGTQPRGKQVLAPKGIWYTAVTGIWQTVWLEPVPATRLEAVELRPDVSGERLVLRGVGKGLEAAGLRLVAVSSPPGQPPSRTQGQASARLTLEVPRPLLWSPDQPFLYPLELTLLRGKEVVDRVSSYFAMREIGIGDGPNGALIELNGEPIFPLGPLDQGWWPDGLYTPATDAALVHDLEVVRSLGFNALRKHVKVESERFYWHTDRLGLLVIQDMPNGDDHIGVHDPDLERTPASVAQYERELDRLVLGRGHHPSIVAWVAFNEGWGQFDTARITERIERLDPTRLVLGSTGWVDRGVGSVHSVHRYPGPAMPFATDGRAPLLGEFGGLGLPLEGHLWQEDRNWGYRSFDTLEELDSRYETLMDDLLPLVDQGLAGAIYTQVSDVEIEVNGLMTYDREVTKLDSTRTRAAHERIYQHATRASKPATGDSDMTVISEPWGEAWGQPVRRFTLRDGDGMEVEISDLGGLILALRVPDRDGQTGDVVLGLSTPQEYLDGAPYFGAIVGRYANRIAEGRFELDGKSYQLARNNGPNSLHGGDLGFDKRIWNARTIEDDRGIGLELSRTSPDGEEGYPGALETTVRYILTGDRTLRIETEATTDAPTVMNVSFHSYFNLRGEGDGTILDHELQIEAGRYTPVDETLIPTGELARVDDTPMDFRAATAIGERIDADFEQLRFGGGYDHNWSLGWRDGALRRAARVREPESGRVLELFTTEPGVQFYSGNFLDGSLTGKSGKNYPHRSGFCLEPQHYPDSPNQPDFPTTVLRPGETYRSLTLYRFGVD